MISKGSASAFRQLHSHQDLIEYFQAIFTELQICSLSDALAKAPVPPPSSSFLLPLLAQHTLITELKPVHGWLAGRPNIRFGKLSPRSFLPAMPN